VGLAIATVAAIASLLWVVVATIGVMANVNASRENGSTQTDVLAQARIAALAARGDETLTLVARGSGGAFEERYEKTQQELAGGDGLLAEARGLASAPDVVDAVATATEAQRSWQQVHTAIRTADDSGDYPQAVTLTIGTDPNGAATHFDKVDEQLARAIEHTQSAFSDEVSQADSALTGTVIGVILLALVTAGGAVFGIWQRLKEYR
jgi:hypothetical protein